MAENPITTAGEEQDLQQIKNTTTSLENISLCEAFSWFVAFSQWKIASPSAFY